MKVQLARWRRQGGKNSPWPGPQEYEPLAHICVGREAEKGMFGSHFPSCIQSGPPACRTGTPQSGVPCLQLILSGKAVIVTAARLPHKVFINRHKSYSSSLFSLPDSSYRQRWTVTHLPDLTVSYIRAKTSLTAHHCNIRLSKMLRTCLLQEEQADTSASPAS